MKRLIKKLCSAMLDYIETLRAENRRLKRRNRDLLQKNQELQAKIARLEASNERLIGEKVSLTLQRDFPTIRAKYSRMTVNR